MISHRYLFQEYLAPTSRAPLLLEIERAEGVYMYDPDGKSYLDLISGIGVSNVGHRHPDVLRAIREQCDRYLHLMVYGEVVQAPQVLLAKRLCETFDGGLNRIYFVNSGSEAAEAALKLAKRYTGRHEVLACRNAYHGSTHGALSLGSHESMKRAYRPLLPGVGHIEFNRKEDLELITEHTAAVFIEPVQGEAGVRPADAGYVQALRRQCSELGVLLVFDEIQTGFGRTGTFWAFEQFNIVPDIVLMAKGMGGGMPLGALAASEEVLSAFAERPALGHITTFGGHPVSCAASLAALNVILNGRLHEQAEDKAKLFVKLLGMHPLVKEIRYKGLMMAVELGRTELVQQVISNALKNGLLTDWFLYCDTALRIAPPLTITEAEIEDACRRLVKAFDDASV